MIYLAINTETAGRIQSHLPADHIMQPPIIQLAAYAFDDAGRTVDQRTMFVKPHPGAVFDHQTIVQQKAHLAQAFQQGLEAKDAWTWIQSMVSSATAIISHDRSIHVAALEAMGARHGKTAWRLPSPWHCTLEGAVAVLEASQRQSHVRELSHPRKRKFSLPQCLSYFLGEETPTGFDLLSEAIATGRLFRRLQGLDRRTG